MLPLRKIKRAATNRTSRYKLEQIIFCPAAPMPTHYLYQFVNNFFGLHLSINKSIFYLWTKLDQMASVKKYNSFGENLRTLREEAGQTLKTVAEQINIDISLLAKIERNERQPTKQLIKQMATFFKVDEKELQNEFLSDQIAYKILDEEADLNILKVAEEKVSYLKTKRNAD